MPSWMTNWMLIKPTALSKRAMTVVASTTRSVSAGVSVIGG